MTVNKEVEDTDETENTADNAESAVSEQKDFIKSGDTENTLIEVLELLDSYSQIDGAHHKAWVLDQIARVITGDKYDKFIAHYCFDGLEIPDEETLQKYRKIAEGDYYEGDYSEDEINLVEGSYYEWDEGIAP